MFGAEAIEFEKVDDLKLFGMHCVDDAHLNMFGMQVGPPSTKQKKPDKSKGGKQVQKSQAVPGVVLGSPLPDHGTCSHFKKSYRWYNSAVLTLHGACASGGCDRLRFPCCDRVFPCEQCHDKATEDGHPAE